jgi:ribonuclease HepT-like protein
MNDKFLILERNVQSDLAVIERIYSELGEPELAESDEQEALIVVAYRLHSLYSAFENIFRNIATTFENHLDPSSWHRQLLERMRLDLSPVRPAVIDEETFEKFDELLRFRHLFRTGYGLKLDALRLRLVVRKALELKPIYWGEVDRFLDYLRRLE